MFRFLARHCQRILQGLPEGRLLALDVFRGLTISAMILVNNPGSWQHIYAPMEHASWHGWTPTDLIFPFFIFIVGVSVALSTKRQQSAMQTPSYMLRQAALRSAKLLLLGWFLALFYYNFSAEHYDWIEQRLMHMRFLGVLQRIALVYFVCALMTWWLSWRQLVLSITLILVSYYLLMAYLPYSDSAGHTYVGLLEFGNNLSAWVDHAILTPQHVYYPDARPFTFDPEGLLSTLPAIASGLCGVLVGQWLLSPLERLTQVKWLAVAGGVLCVAGDVWSMWFPVNKALWTSSYVLLTTGLAIWVLAACLYCLDIRKWRLWSAPFVVCGTNSIAFFMFAGVVGRLVIMLPIGDISLKTYLYQRFFQPLGGDLNGSLAYAVGFLLLSYGVMYGLYRKGIFWKV